MVTDTGRTGNRGGRTKTVVGPIQDRQGPVVHAAQGSRFVTDNLTRRGGGQCPMSLQV